jgi:hypothetical protein
MVMAIRGRSYASPSVAKAGGFVSNGAGELRLVYFRFMDFELFIWNTGRIP